MCDILGVADIGIICDFNKSCFVIEDEGFQVVYILVYELGKICRVRIYFIVLEGSFFLNVVGLEFEE